MELAVGDDATARVSRFLRRRVRKKVPLVTTPDEFVRAGFGTHEAIAFGLGHHPEVVARVWDALAVGLPGQAAVLVSATPALVDPETGRLVAFVSGMTYMVRVPESQRATVFALGYRAEFTGTWPNERDDPPDFGPEWVDGRWQEVELSWVRAFIAPTPAPAPDAEQGAPDRRGM